LCFAVPTWLYLVFTPFLSIVAHHPPLATILSRTCRRRPLCCGSVPRACRYTGIIITLFRPHSITPTPPWTFQSSDSGPPGDDLPLLCICLLTSRYLMLICPQHEHLSRIERLITVPLLRLNPIPHPAPPIAFPLKTPVPTSYDARPLFSFSSRRTTVVALDIACLHERMTRLHSLSSTGRHGLVWRGVMWIRKTAFRPDYLRLLSRYTQCYTPAHISFRLLHSRTAACQSRPTR